MAPFALLFGGLLIGLGLIGYLKPEMLGSFDKISPTALIPAFIGALILIAGIVTILKPTLKKHMMHVAALAGVFGVIGGFMPMNRSGFDFSKASAVTGILMTSLSVIFVTLCVKSFIDARKARAKNS
ncbi:MAG: hypothetical protein K8T89_08120 [Planctomycetes bacterium]|nr:hypothetical protein [Planctomycetota bacterium]